MAYVYQHIRLDNNQVFYIGIGSDSEGRYKRAKRKSGRSLYWNNVSNKYGYSIEILFDNISFDEAKLIEKELIKKHGRDKLVNLTDGGDGVCGHSPSDETRRIWSIQRKGKDYWSGRKHKEESKKILSQKSMGRIPGNKGVPMTEEQKRKLSEKCKGRISPKRKKILCVNNNTIYKSTEEAAKILGLNRSCVSRVAQGKRKDTMGFIFKYLE